MQPDQVLSKREALPSLKAIRFLQAETSRWVFPHKGVSTTVGKRGGMSGQVTLSTADRPFELGALRLPAKGKMPLEIQDFSPLN